MNPVGIILAAGRGVRLGGLTADTQKGLLEVNGLSLIARQIYALKAFQINHIYIITGFAEESLKKAFGNQVKYIFNPSWDTANNIYSLYMAKEVARQGFILINSDDLFHIGILKNLIIADHADAIIVDDVKTLGEEEMKVKLEKGFLKEINKTMDAASAQGEYIGMAKFSSDGAQALFQVIEDFVSRDELDCWYEKAFGVLAESRSIAAVSTGGLPWTEIDTPDDLDKAAKEIVPVIDDNQQQQT